MSDIKGSKDKKVLEHDLVQCRVYKYYQEIVLQEITNWIEWMQFKRTITYNEVYWTAICVHRNSDGTKCDQIGRKLDQTFYTALYKKIVHIDEQLIASINTKRVQFQEIESLICVKQAEIAKVDQAINKLLELFEEGKMSTQILTERIEKREKAKESLKAEIE